MESRFEYLQPLFVGYCARTESHCDNLSKTEQYAAHFPRTVVYRKTGCTCKKKKTLCIKELTDHNIEIQTAHDKYCAIDTFF